MSANTEKCSDKDKSFCEYNEFSRLRYFHGMLLDDKDFRAEQQYHAGKRRFLNRMLHGSGVVCGLELKGEKDKRWIKVTPGVAFDCSGNEIWVSEEQKIDLATLLPPKKQEKSDKCVEDDPKEPNTYYIGIRYEEKPTNPVSVYLPSGSCEERTCENSRWKEGYCIEIVECCKEKETPGLIYNYCHCTDAYSGAYQDLCGKCQPAQSNTANPNQPAAKDCKCMTIEEFCEQSVPCGECCSCDKPCYVILGQIKVEDCMLKQLCMNECRRYVLTGRLVQNLLVRIFSQAEGYFKIVDVNGNKTDLPGRLMDYVYNPIKALCWWLPYKLKKAKFEWAGCDPTVVPPPPPPPPEVIYQTLQAFAVQLEEVKAENTKLYARFDEWDKLGVSPSQASIVNQPAQKPTKK